MEIQHIPHNLRAGVEYERSRVCCSKVEVGWAVVQQHTIEWEHGVKQVYMIFINRKIMLCFGHYTAQGLQVSKYHRSLCLGV